MRNPRNRIQAELCRRDYYEFFRQYWDVIEPEGLIDNWHIPKLAAELQTIAERVIQRKPKLYDLVITIPPGMSKSSLVSTFFPAWCWTQDPTLRFIVASYSGQLAMNHALKSRDVIQSEQYRRMYPDINLRRDQNVKSLFLNNAGGGRLSTSVGGSVTGLHAHIILIDDPLNPQEAASDAEREAANYFIRNTLSTRKVDKRITPIILVMQRLHVDDPAGMLLQRDGVKHINLPGRLTDKVRPEDWKQYYQNELLDPQRLDEQTLQRLFVELGSYGFAGQIMQTPTPEGGGIWQDWFVPVPDSQFPDSGRLADYGTDWDLAYTEKQSNSASAYIVSGKKDHDIYIDKLGFVYKEMPELIKFMKTLPEHHYIEGKASGKSAKQWLINEGIAAKETPVEGGDKVARARLVTPKAEAGFVYVRESQLEKLYHDPQQGILNFPNAPKDDLADALSQALQRHSRKAKKITSPPLPGSVQAKVRRQRRNKNSNHSLQSAIKGGRVIGSVSHKM